MKLDIENNVTSPEVEDKEKSESFSAETHRLLDEIYKDYTDEEGGSQKDKESKNKEEL